MPGFQIVRCRRPSQAAAEKPEGVRSILRTHPRFAGFTAVAFLWNLSLMVAGPFFSVYLVRDLGASPTQIGLLAAIFSATNIVGQRVWGRLNDRHGATWVMRLTGFMIPAVPLLWSVAPNPWYLLAVEAFSGFVWAGYGLASFNLAAEPGAGGAARTLHGDLSGVRLRFGVHRAAAGQRAGRRPRHPAALLDFSRRPGDRLHPLPVHGAR